MHLWHTSHDRWWLLLISSCVNLFRGDKSNRKDIVVYDLRNWKSNWMISPRSESVDRLGMPLRNADLKFVVLLRSFEWKRWLLFWTLLRLSLQAERSRCTVIKMRFWLASEGKWNYHVDEHSPCRVSEPKTELDILERLSWSLVNVVGWLID